MSQAKVDKYKKDKANRQQIMKKEKMERTIWKVGGSLLVLLMAGWVGFSAYTKIDQMTEKPITSESYEVNTSAISDYLFSISEDDAQ